MYADCAWGWGAQLGKGPQVTDLSLNPQGPWKAGAATPRQENETGLTVLCPLPLHMHHILLSASLLLAQ